jgi:hypothetical protein
MLLLRIINIRGLYLQTNILIIYDLPIYIFYYFSFYIDFMLNTEKNPDWVKINNLSEEVLKLHELIRSSSYADKIN